MDITELVISIIEMMIDMAKMIAGAISDATAGIVPPDAVAPLGILILLVILKAGFDFTKKVIDILIIIFLFYVLIRIIPMILGMF
ncbi:MAG TPA: hypothetical protein ENG41_00870 [Methanomicrobia archaeon]|nr:MAG: hypothetical protein DRN58_04295 [Thermococci archaeon]HDN81262.1 hypothetical protein [Methanomicrobia archaeon]